jgi:pimeloyl-ACP methyl ester carboxylesterase
VTPRHSFSAAPGDSPLRDVPDDYDCGGVGRWFVLPEGPDAGRKLYFWDRRVGVSAADSALGRPPGASAESAAPVILLVHGNPECSYTFRKLVAALATRNLPPGTRVVAMDHLGFGRSDQASFEMVEMHHAANLRSLVRALDLRDVTLVVHDWGGPIGVGALIDEPERVRGLVVLNTTVFPLPDDPPTFDSYPLPVLPWSRMPLVVPDRWWGALAGLVVGLTPTGAAGLVTAMARSLGEVLRGSPPGWDPVAGRVFSQQFASTANARSSKRLVRQTPVWGHGYAYDDRRLGRQDTTPFYRHLQDRLPRVWGPAGQGIGVAGVFGAWDPLAKASALAQWRAALPQIEGRLQVLDGVSHFVEEHRPEAIADAVEAVL